jgi:hypothetical protein
MEIRYAKSAGKHGITEFDIEKIIFENSFFDLPLSLDGKRKIGWTGKSLLGELIEIVAVIYETHYLVIHAMPTWKRKGELDDIKSRLW